MSYMTKEFAKLGNAEEARIKVTSSQGETHWISINQHDLMEVFLILKKREDEDTATLLEALGLDV